MQQIIRATRTQHCSRGPIICAKCRAMDEVKWMLLDIEPPNEDRVARPVVELVLNGKPEYRVYDVMRVFVSEDEAREYATEYQIPLYV
jgi:hypothetical protein